MKIEWCTKKLTIEEAEQRNLVEDSRLGDRPVPFGFMYGSWVALKKKLREGDELWEFRSPQEDWDNLGGREGVCIVRDGEIADLIVTRMS